MNTPKQHALLDESIASAEIAGAQSVEESFKINWKAIACKRLIDAGVSPKTTVELVITLEGLLEHHITTTRQQAFEEGVKAERERVRKWVENRSWCVPQELKERTLYLDASLTEIGDFLSDNK